MIPAGGDKSFYDSFKKTEAAFRKAGSSSIKLLKEEPIKKMNLL